MTTNNHFISVSRAGALMARRRGGAPLQVATTTTGIAVDTDDAARERGAPISVRVHFMAGGGNRQLHVTGVEVDGARLDVDAFLRRYAVPEDALGRWLRAAVERALDHG